MLRLRVGTWAGTTSALLLALACSSGRHDAPPLDGQPSTGNGALDAAIPFDAALQDAARHDASAALDGSTSDSSTTPDAATPDAGNPGAPALIAPEAHAPSYLGILAGPGAAAPQAGLRLYGTDLGISFEHAGELQILFGDTWAHEEQVCGDAPINDDTIARLPMTLGSELPTPAFITDPAQPNEPLAAQLLRGDESLSMGFGQVPMAAFSDGEHAFAFFARLAPQSCDEAAQCGTEPSLSCSARIGECQPAYTTMVLSCDLETQLGCLPGQECVAGPPICIDPSSAQYDGSIFGETSAIAQQVELAVQGGRGDQFRSIHTWPTSKFATLTARTVQRFSGASTGNDYAPGHGDLLVWGRPGFIGEHGRESQLYLMTHRLPLDPERPSFAPRFFAGLDPATHEPTWTDDQATAEPLALDGISGGDPREERPFTGQPAVSWLGAPIHKWVMLYGGDITDLLMVDALASRSARAPGAIMIRFAEQPWGPWSPPVPHLIPGVPDRPGSLYAPDGLLFHPDCTDTERTRCARSDPWRPPDSATACLISTQALDPGRLYGVNIIDNYTAPNDEGGLDFVWNVSLWNPYAVALMKTRVVPPSHASFADELADADGLARLSDLARLPTLEPGRRYRQQSSRDRGTDDTSFPLSGFGNRDFNNFVCKSADAELAPDQFAPFAFDEPECAEPYVRGAVLARFEGPGRLVRMWLGMASLMFAPADDEMLRIYVDDEPVPRVEQRLADVLDGSAGEIFAPPFGAGSPRRLAWYYPLAFEHKLVVALDRLGAFDEYFYHCDVVHEPELAGAVEPASRMDRQRAQSQLGATFHPVGRLQALMPTEELAIAPTHHRQLVLEGPATIHELELRFDEVDLPALAGVQVRARWDGATEDAIAVPLLELFAAGRVAPEQSTLALTSFVEADERVLVLKLPMPFVAQARWTFENRGDQTARFTVAVRGRAQVPPPPFGKLHVVRSDLDTATADTNHASVALEGHGRLVGLCAYMEGNPDPDGGLQYDPLNMLEGDIRVWTDDALALDGTGTEEYADDVFYFSDAPHGSAFAQAWGLVNDVSQSLLGEVNFCRWHVLGTEVDFERSLHAGFELGGAGNPEIVARHRTVAYVYLAD